MLNSRARKTFAGLVLSASMVLGTTAAVQAAAPANSASSTSADSAQISARKAPQPKKLRNIKYKATKLAVKKKTQYSSVQRYISSNSATIPASVAAVASKQVTAGNKRLNKQVIKVSRAKTVKKVKVLRGKIRAQRPNDVKQLVIIAQRAIAAGDDKGALEDLLDDLLGLDLSDSLLGPILELVDGLLGSVGGGGSSNGLLGGLLDLLNDLLGGLLGGRR